MDTTRNSLGNHLYKPIAMPRSSNMRSYFCIYLSFIEMLLYYINQIIIYV